MLKSEIRIVGFDDGPFSGRRGRVAVIGVIYRGGNFLDGILRTNVKVDGLDSTEKLIDVINESRHKKELKIIMTDGLTLGGFNLIDVKSLHRKTGLPVIVVNRKHPNLKEVRSALKNNFRDFEKRWKIIRNAGKIKETQLRNGTKIFYQNIGISDEDAEDAIAISCSHGQIPEALRVAHLIVTAIVRGESFGRA